jgi:threonine dehydratase
MEAFGTEHKNKIIKVLKDTGFQPQLKNSKSVF